MINVTKTFLPPQAEYQNILKRAWETGWITNRGVLVKELESKLKGFLDMRNAICMTNGTLPIQIAIKALGLSGEIITTPFSYVATTSSIVWENCKPVFVDIHSEYLTIDETKIRSAITSKTSAILATHVFGNPCHVEVINKIANDYGLKVIYDAAHCFGVNYKDKSIFKYGDISTCSFHATKVFHTGEGGAAFFNTDELYNKVYYHHNFGHDGTERYFGLGINAKMSELQAAMGLAVFPYVSKILSRRQNQVKYYNKLLKNSDIQYLKIREHTQWNFSYYPILLKSESILENVIKALAKEDIHPRRYFFPSLDNLPYIKNQDCPISNDIASRVICLPLYFELSLDQQRRIADIIKLCL